jgi:hypothetical protein
MKSICFYFVFACAFLGSVSPTYAGKPFEKGFIITQANDTILGLIQDLPTDFLHNSITFKKRLNDAPIIYDATQIKGFYLYPKQYFEAAYIWDGKKKHGQYYFLKREVGGYISLYSYNERLFVRKGEKPIIPLYITVKYINADSRDTTQTPIDTLYSFAPEQNTSFTYGRDYARILSKLCEDWDGWKIEAIPFNIGAIKSKIMSYNAAKYPDIDKNKARWQENYYYLKLGVGAALPYIRINDLPMTVYNKVYTPLVGGAFSIELQNRVWSKNVSLKFNVINYAANHNFTIGTDNPINGHSLTNKEYINNTSYALNINYNFFTTKRISPYVHLGGFLTTHKANIFYQEAYLVIFTVEHTATESQRFINFDGISYGIGANFNINDRQAINADITRYYSPYAIPKVIIAQIGYSYKFSL